MAIQTPVHKIINKMVEIMQSSNRTDDFNKFCNSITIDEWKDLRDFGESLTRLSTAHIKHNIRLIK